jgi:mxaJ protein
MHISSVASLVALFLLLSSVAPNFASAQNAGLGAAGELVDPSVLRVCADPSNMPFSDQSGEGFEDRLAQLLAKETGRQSVSYVWFPSVMGFVRNTLGANRCDIIMGYAQGDELVQNTNAYYRSSYVLITKKASELSSVETLSDPRLSGKRLGVVEATPPSALMAEAKLMSKAKVYPLMIDTRLNPSPAEIMIKDLDAGVIDAAVAWGPMAGYFVNQASDRLQLTPLIKEKGGQRMIYRITMGVRPSDQQWKRRLNDFIKNHQGQINEVLLSYGVPLLDEKDNLITVQTTQ